MTRRSWVAAGHSVIGANHVRRGIPNQDRARWDPDRMPAVVAVSDGHTTAARGERGAQLAVDLAIELLTSPAGDGRIGMEIERFLPEFVDRWNVLVDADVRADPLEGLDDPRLAYGCTFLLVVAGDLEVAAVQIGDGDIVVGGAEIAPRYLVQPDPTLVGDLTHSLCSPAAVRHGRFGRIAVEAGGVDTVLVATDGFANSYPEEAWPGLVVEDYRERLVDGGIDDVRQRLPGWLQTSADAAGDDTTVVLLHRPGEAAKRSAASAVSAAATSPAGAGVAEPSRHEPIRRSETTASARPSPILAPPGPGEARRSAGRRLALVGGFVALAVLAVVGVATARSMLDSDRGPDEPTSTQPATSRPATSTTAPPSTTTTTVGTDGPDAFTTIPGERITVPPGGPGADGVPEAPEPSQEPGP